MSFLGFPIRLENGFLRRVDEASAVLALIEIMARTPHGSWPGCPHFGLRDYLNGPVHVPEVTRTALVELNRALSDLGIRNYRVDTLVREAPGSTGSAMFAVALVSGDGHKQVFRVSAGN
jgi:hypothetical protein